MIKCPLCKGFGVFDDVLYPFGRPCGLCNGKGKVSQKVKMQYVRSYKND